MDGSGKGKRKSNENYIVSVSMATFLTVHTETIATFFLVMKEGNDDNK